MSGKCPPGDQSGNNPGSPPGRRHPRFPGEIGPRARSDLARFSPHLSKLRAEAIAHLGGETSVSALRLEILEMGLLARTMVSLLMNEVAAKARASKDAGHTPHPSRWRATELIPKWVTVAHQCFKSVGLDKIPTNVEDIRSMWSTGHDDATDAPTARDSDDGDQPVEPTKRTTQRDVRSEETA
jgi:hypothetical protein